MPFKQILISALLFILASGCPVWAQEDDIPAEDREVIEVLDILENLEVLEEDLDLIEFLTEVGDDYEE
ncbi:MAG: hypothetical protein PVI13_10550 [Desulfobacterales bacterium]|jgi:hypothetical protein